MSGGRWQQVRTILESALQLDAERRRAYLDQVCPSDPSLRREVESLLAAGDQARSSFLQSPPLMTRLEKGTNIGDYEVQSLLGAGGMGEVYRARDLRLRREVAIKVLPSFLASNPDRLRRFEQEATAAAALNHPNILAVYQLGTYGGAPYLVSELLEGSTLRELMTRGPLAQRKAVDYAIQISRGLAAAHEKGIVHRDLKPENLFVTKDGRVKILDFGLAKLTRAAHSSEHSAPTIGNATEPGVVMGTVGYMSPEQVRGESTDNRTDIFAFGAILYEMLAGKRAFRQPTSAETMTAILNDDPPGISQVMPATSLALRRVVHRCLEKNPEQRFQSASDLSFALEALSDSTNSSPGALTIPSKRGSRSWQLVTFAAIFVSVAIIAAGARWMFSEPPPPRVLGTTKITHDGLSKLQVFTDGTRLYISERKISDEFVVQGSVAGGETSPLLMPFPSVYPTDISPDHSQLFLFERDQTGREYRAWLLPLPTGPPRRLADLVGHWGTWSSDGQHLLLARGNDLYLSRADGGDLHKLASLPGRAFYVRFSPDGRRIRFTLSRENAVSIWEIRADGSGLHRVFPEWQGSSSEHDGEWTADGRYYFFLAKNGPLYEIWASRERTGILRRHSGLPVKLATGQLSYGQMALSPDGKKMYVDGYEDRGELVRYDSSSHQFVPYLSGISAGELDFSRDGQWVTYVSYPEGSLWKCRRDGTERIQLTYPPIDVALPQWSPDGSQIAFVDKERGSRWRILLIPSDGGTPQEAYPESRNQVDATWSPDGKQLAFGRIPDRGATEKLDINILDLNTHQIATISTEENLRSPRWSPDGRHILALTEDEKKLALYELKTHKWSEWINEPGAIAFPIWSQDGRYVYYDRVLTDHPSFRRVRFGENRSESVIDLKDMPRYYNISIGPWSGLTPDGAALFVRSLSTDEIYALDLQLP